MNNGPSPKASSREELLAAWEDVYGQPPPKGLSLPLLQMSLAYKRQVDVHGGPTRRTMDALRQAVRPGSPPPARRPRPGAVLVREWNGVTHIVEVLDTGYRYNDRHYRSLTPIARLITGTGWSGPRFFGFKVRVS